MKKIINNPNDVVTEMLQGLAKANPNVVYTGEETQTIHRKEKKAGKVGVISGGGSGHEPAHAGYVGYGMLDAAVAGNVFASPDPTRIIEGLQAADSGAGVLMVIKNYSGDIMNFEAAGEMAADFYDIQTASVIVKDDVAVPDSTYSAGRRGIAGTVFVHKVAGAAAEQGKTLAEVQAAAQKAADNVRTMGMCMENCILPANGKPSRVLAADEMEVGMGIHSEPGITTQKMGTAKEIAEILTSKVLEDLDFSGSEVAVMINGLGGTPLMELYILNNEVEKILTEKGIKVYRTFVGNYMTSLEMAGCSVSLLRLDEELKGYLDYPSKAPAFPV